MKVYMVLNTVRPGSFKVAYTAAEILLQNCAEVLVLPEYLALFGHLAVQTMQDEPQALAACDMVLTIGGDGTMLHVAHKLVGRPKPLMGINTGHLGFLTALEPGELECLSALCDGRYCVENHTLLEADNSAGFEAPCYALNDLVLFKESPGGMVYLDILCDDVPVSRFKGDGVIFSTPTGSTAYSMSAGGPIVDASLQALTVTQICAHIVRMPPMVFSGRRLLKVVPDLTKDNYVVPSCDGMKSTSLDGRRPIYIRQSALFIPMVTLEGAGQLWAIDKKLKVR